MPTYFWKLVVANSANEKRLPNHHPLISSAQRCIRVRRLPQISLQWRHNGRDCVSSHQPHHCLHSRLFRHRRKKTSKLRVTGLCAGNSLGTGEFPAQMASNAEKVSIWWRHHVQGESDKWKQYGHHAKPKGVWANSSIPLLVQIMACRLFLTKSLSEQIPGFLLIKPLGTHCSEIWLKYSNLHTRKCIWMYRLHIDSGHFVSASV